MISALTAHLWQSTWFAIAAGILTLGFRKNRAQVRYWLWLSASFKFLLPFSLLMSLASHVKWAPLAHKTAAADVSLVIERITQPFAGPSSFTAASGAVRWGFFAFLGLWACGFVAIGLMRLRSWLLIRAAVSASTPLEISAAVEIRSSPGLLEPGVVGLLRPILLVPEGIMECLTPSQREAVLAHELCHVHRRDNLFASIHMIVEAIFWFHPFVWWIGGRLVEERERACDEEVLSLGSEPRIYADAILNVCKLYVESPLACVSGVTGADLKRRIEAIMANRAGQRLNRAKKLLLAVAAIAALAGPVMIGFLIGAGNAPAAPPPYQAAAVAHQRLGYEGRRLVAMMFDFRAMTSDEQSRARQSGIDFVRGRMTTADLVAILALENGKVTVTEDFTDDRNVIESTILKLPAGEATEAAPDVGLMLSSLDSAATILGVLPDKKMLMYFSKGIAQAGAGNQAELRRVIESLKNTNIAIYSIDVRGIVPQPIAQSGGRSVPMERPSIATYEGAPAVESILAEALSRESGDRADGVAKPIAGLPGGGHAAFHIDPTGRLQALSIPLDSLSGRIDILGQIKTLRNTGAPEEVAGSLRDNIQATGGIYRARFVLGAGSYICDLIVREQATGRIYGETIQFEVK